MQKRWRNFYHANGNEKNTPVAILISDKMTFFFFFLQNDFKYKTVAKDKEGHT